MEFFNRHPEAELIQYLDGELADDESRRLEEHLITCSDCRNDVTFVRDFGDAVAALPKEALIPNGPCPDNWTLASYEAGEVDERIARALRSHVARCDECARKYYALQQARPTAIEIFLRFAGSVVDSIRRPDTGICVPRPMALQTRGGRALAVSPFSVSQRANDPETKTSSTISLHVERDFESQGAVDAFAISIQSDLPRADWAAELFDEGRRSLRRISLRLPSVTTLKSNLDPGRYDIEISSYFHAERAFKLLMFSLTIEPFTYPEFIERILDHLEARDYAFAIALLDVAIQEYPDSRELRDLDCLALSLAMYDEKSEALQRGIATVRSAGNLRQATVQSLKAARQLPDLNGNDDMATYVVSGLIDPASPLPDVLSRISGETQLLSLLYALRLIYERTSFRQDLKEVFAEVLSRQEKLLAAFSSLQRQVSQIRQQQEPEDDEKVPAITNLLERLDREAEVAHVSLGPQRAFLAKALGKGCWEWIGTAVQDRWSTAESVYRHLARAASIETMDFALALVGLCSGLETLLNEIVRSACEETREILRNSTDLRRTVESRLSSFRLVTSPKRVDSYTITQAAILLRAAMTIREADPTVIAKNTALRRALPLLNDLTSLEALRLVGTRLRNGAAHTDACDPARIELARKLVLGVDEYWIGNGPVLDWIADSIWLSPSERNLVRTTVSGAWRDYPGLGKILFATLALHD